MKRLRSNLVPMPSSRLERSWQISEELVDAVEIAVQAEYAAQDRRRHGERSSPLFFFARELRLVLDDFEESEAINLVGKILTMRHHQPRDPWAAAFPDCPVDPAVAFAENLRLIRFPSGMFDHAVALAKSRPLPVDEISRGYALFKVLCQVLQELHGNQPFILSVERFAKALGVCRESITYYKRRGIEKGWLQVVSAPIPRKRAGRYRFITPTTSQEGSGGFLKGLEGRNTGRGGNDAHGVEKEAADEKQGALAMLNAFASVGALSFDITLTDVKGTKLKFRRNHKVETLRRIVGAMLLQSQRDQNNLIIRPRSTMARLVQLDDLDAEKAKQMAPHAFMIVRTSPGNHQAWVAVNDAPEDFARRLRKSSGADPTASGATRIAGSLNFKTEYAPEFPMVEITYVNAGNVTTTATLNEAGFVAAPDQPEPPLPPADAGRHGGEAWPDYQRCVLGAPLAHSKDQPDISRADFTWCRTAIQWGWTVEATASRLMELSSKASENGKRYALRTATRAAESVEVSRTGYAKRCAVNREALGRF
jgi:hypothetical protein